MTRRTERVARAVKNAVSEIILHELSDPRRGFVTVTRAEVSTDLKNACVYISIIGTEAEQRTTLAGLSHATSYVRRRLAEKVELKTTPLIRFEVDLGVKRSIRISELLRRVAGENGEQSGTS